MLQAFHKLIAIRLRATLAVLIAMALLAPLPAGESVASNLPVCCLGHGEHHCLGQMLGGEESQGFSANVATCPYAPLALTALHGPHLAPPVAAQTLFVAVRPEPLALEATAAINWSTVDFRPERGPPDFSLN